MIEKFEKRCVLNIYIILLRHIFDTTYKGENRLKYTCELCITNWYYSKKEGIIFAMYHRMISKGTFWDGPRNYEWSLISSYLLLTLYHYGLYAIMCYQETLIIHLNLNKK